MFVIGTDLVEVKRIEKAVSRWGDRFLRRVFTQGEIDYCGRRVESLAARWAAKEAVSKALGTGWVRGISWRDVEIRNEPGGKPVVGVRGGAKEVVEQLGIAKILVSISHCHTHATAYAIAVGKEPRGMKTE